MQSLENQPASILQRAAEVLPRAELLFTTSAVIGAVLWFMNYDQRVLSLSLACLAVIHFISAFRPVNIPFKENEQLNFTALLALVIVPKIAWINCAVIVIGILVYLLNPASVGYQQMLLIGTLSFLAIGIIMVYALVSHVPYLKFVMPVLWRVAPLLLIAVYLLMK